MSVYWTIAIIRCAAYQTFLELEWSTPIHDSLIVPYLQRSFGRQIRLAVGCNRGDVTEPQTLDHLLHFVS